MTENAFSVSMPYGLHLMYVVLMVTYETIIIEEWEVGKDEWQIKILIWVLFYYWKITAHPLQSTISPSSKYHNILFKVPHHPLQSTTSPSSKYHITLFKVPY